MVSNRTRFDRGLVNFCKYSKQRGLWGELKIQERYEVKKMFSLVFHASSYDLVV